MVQPVPSRYTGHLIAASQLIQGNYGNTNKIGLALFWAMTQRVEVIPYRRFGTAYRSHLQYHYTVHNNPEQRSSHLLPRRKPDIKLGLLAGKSVCVCVCVCGEFTSAGCTEHCRWQGASPP